MKKKKMNMTDKRKSRDESMINWETRLQIAFLKNQNPKLKSEAIGKMLTPNISGARVRKIYSQIKNSTIQELEEMMKKYK